MCRILKALGINEYPIRIIDSTHNNISVKEYDNKLLYIHRKGASPADAGPIAIPGSRGSFSYLVLPADNTEMSGYSLAHGAGRKWERSMCRSRLENKYTKETIKYTRLKGRVVCNDNSLLFEEAPEAYKNIETVIQSLLNNGLITLIAAFKPVLTYKA